MNELILIVLAIVSAVLSASLGAGGGILLLSLLPGFISTAAIIPVHGMVQLASNVSRVPVCDRSGYVLQVKPGSAKT